jgi:hypothetical protein
MRIYSRRYPYRRQDMIVLAATSLSRKQGVDRVNPAQICVLYLLFLFLFFGGGGGGGGEEREGFHVQ